MHPSWQVLVSRKKGKRDQKKKEQKEEALHKKKDVLGKALVKAALKGDVKVVARLLEDPRTNPCLVVEDGEEYPTNALLEAVKGEHVEVVRLLLRHPSVDPSFALRDRRWPGPGTALVFAAEIGLSDVAAVLLGDCRVNPGDHGNIALYQAARKGHLDFVKLLLNDPRVDPAAEDNEIIFSAVQSAYALEVVKFLLQDARVNGTCAIRYARRSVVPLLIENDRCGICANREIFERFHPWAVKMYDQLCAEREERICAVFWCMKEIGQGWGDLKEPTGGRMEEQTLDWG